MISTLSVSAIVSLPCMAFNSDDCTRFRARHDRYSNIDPVGTMLSTTQATSSFGECSLLRKPGNTRLEFVKSNYEPLKIDIAKGNGEYLLAYSDLLLCNDESSLELRKKFKENYAKIFSDQSNVDHTIAYIEMDKIITDNSRIRVGCYFLK